MKKHDDEEQKAAAEEQAQTKAAGAEEPSPVPVEVEAPVSGPPPEEPQREEAPKPTPSPRSRLVQPTNNYSPVLAAHHDRGGPITEQYRALRTHLLAHYEDKRFATLVTSAEAGEGKTLTSLNLGIILAERTERTTVVVDCDLRRGRVAKYLSMDESPGMADVVGNKASLDDVLRPTVYPNLFVITAGKLRQNEVGELMGRPELQEVAMELRRRFDYVLFDTPPINRAADAGQLGRVVDGALVIVRMNKTHRESVDRAIRLLHAANVTVSGLVLTHQQYFIPNYLYRYS
jgi:capsular exopolysaccharide synthesis family protein